MSYENRPNQMFNMRPNAPNSTQSATAFLRSLQQQHQQQHAVTPQPIVQALPEVREAIKGPTGKFLMNQNVDLIVQCGDGKMMSMEKEVAAKCPFIMEGSEDAEAEVMIYRFDFASPILEVLVHWTKQYGADGKAASPLVKPCVYRDFSYVVTDPWDEEFYTKWLSKNEYEKYYLQIMNAAEKYDMHGLIDFMAVALGCRLRSDEDEIFLRNILNVPVDVAITEEDLAAVEHDYPWFDDATKPTFVQ